MAKDSPALQGPIADGELQLDKFVSPVDRLSPSAGGYVASAAGALDRAGDEIEGALEELA